MKGGIAVAGALAGVAGWALYQGQWPTAQGFGRTLVGSPGEGNLLALTYDDGPNAAWTPSLLEVLEKYRAKATFFSIGHYAEKEPGLLREVAAAGHAIGNHTYSHITMPFHSDRSVREELRRTTSAIEAAGVEMATYDGMRLMRPPYGRRRPGTLKVLREEGYLPVFWSVTLWDWAKRVTSKKIMRKAHRQIRGGDVILLHDGSDVAMGYDRSHSVAATALILEHWQEKGMRFVTVPEMAAAIGFSMLSE